VRASLPPLVQERKQLLQQVAAGEVDLVISTHAALNVEQWARLGLVVIDEQHRWGPGGASCASES
jgi:RecG-like helicase